MAGIHQSALVSDRGLLPFRRRLEYATEVSLSFAQVERAARVCLEQLVTDSLSAPSTSEPETVAPMRRGFRALRVAIEPEASSSRAAHGMVGHVHWHARRFRHLFPVMEADLVAQPLSGGRTQVLLEATYRPPGGVVGVIGDALFGRVVARSTAEEFIDRLSRAMEDAVANRRCGSLASVSTSNGAERR